VVLLKLLLKLNLLLSKPLKLLPVPHLLLVVPKLVALRLLLSLLKRLLERRHLLLIKLVKPLNKLLWLNVLKLLYLHNNLLNY
jgi:hypothetical protein